MNFIFPILSGILLGIGFLNPSLSFFCWFGLLPLLYFLNLKKYSFKRSFFAGFLAGFIYFGQVLIWFFHTWPLDWAGIQSKFIGFLIVFFMWFILVFFLSLFIGLFALTYQFLKRGNWFDFLLIPSLWVISGYLGAFSFSVSVLGTESLFGPHWTFGNLGYLLSQNQIFRSFSGFGGIYLLSFLIVFFNALSYFFLKGVFQNKTIGPKKFFGVSLLILILLISISYYLKPETLEISSDSLRLAILQTKFSSFFDQTEAEFQKKFEVQNQLLKKVNQSFPESQIIVFPEDNRFFLHQDAKEKLVENFPEKEVLIISSSRTETEEGIKSIATLYNSKGEALGQYEKMLLVPLGEYLLYFIRFPAQIINEEWVEKFENSRGYSKGKEVTVFALPFSESVRSIGVLFCSEIFSSGLHRQLVKNNSEVLFNLGSISFSHGSKILDYQTRTLLQLRAAENGRYLVRATNFGTSYIIDNKGKVIEKTPDFENQILFGEVKPISKKTFYTKYGDWILILASLFIFLGLIYRKRLTFSN